MKWAHRGEGTQQQHFFGVGNWWGRPASGEEMGRLQRRVTPTSILIMATVLRKYLPIKVSKSLEIETPDKFHGEVQR